MEKIKNLNNETKIFYKYLIEKGIINKHQNSGTIKNSIIAFSLNNKNGCSIKKVYKKLYETTPNKIKNKGLKLPYWRIYIKLETMIAEVYDDTFNLKETFNWYTNPSKFKYYINDKTKLVEYDLNDPQVNIVEVIQNIYKKFNINDKLKAYKYLNDGIKGWFKPYIYTNKLILNNDKMNEKYVQKDEGAYFTPSKYVKISTKYVMNAIEQSIIDGYDDYVIVDRCVGVGNLESQFTASIYSHLILGTINGAEVISANVRFDGQSNVYKIDALTQEGVKFYQDKIKEYKKVNKVKKLAVIFLENPPYSQRNSNKKGGYKSKYKKTWVHLQLEKGGTDLDEQFVLSAFKYYNIYSYVHYGPIKIWKTRHLIDKKVESAYLCNRSLFNASQSAVALIHWKNEDVVNNEIIFDNDYNEPFIVKKVNSSIATLFKNDGKEKGIVIIEARNYSFASPRLVSSINDSGKYGRKWISKENLLKVLPLFCLGRDKIAETGGLSKEKDYRIIDTLYKSGDGGKEYQKDTKLLQDVLLWTLCTQYNHVSSQNELWKWGESTLNNKLKENEIWKIYQELVNKTGINGLYNIEKYDKNNISTIKLKKLLEKFYIQEIRPKFVRYELLK